MLQPSYSQIMNKLNSDANETVVTSRYSIIIATARRARQIIDIVNAESAGEITSHSASKEAQALRDQLKKKKPTAIAVEELYNGKVKIREQYIDSH